MTVDCTTTERRPVIKATVADGVMHVSRVLRWTTSYRVKAARPRRRTSSSSSCGARATLTSRPENRGVDGRRLSHPARAPAKGEGGVAVVEISRSRKPSGSSISTMQGSASWSRRASSILLRQALSEIAVRRGAAGHQRAELGKLKEQRAQLVEDQNRLRNNISVLGNDAALKKRLLDKFSETETAIETVTAATAKATDALTAAERDLASYIARLTL